MSTRAAEPGQLSQAPSPPYLLTAEDEEVRSVRVQERTESFHTEPPSSQLSGRFLNCLGGGGVMDTLLHIHIDYILGH